MAPDVPDTQEIDAQQFYEQRVMEGRFDEIPMADREVTIDVPEEIVDFCRERLEAARGRGHEDAKLVDFVNDHVNLYLEFTVDGEPVEEVEART